MAWIGFVLALACLRVSCIGGSQDGSRQAALFHACTEGRPESVRLLLEGGAEVAAQDGNGDTPLTKASRFCWLEIVRLLLEKGADMEASGTEGKTPLCLAVEAGCVEVVRLLLEKGANPQAVDTLGRQPLHIAAAQGELGVVQLLLEKKADIEASDKNGSTPLFTAAVSGQLETVRFLVQQGANVSAKDKWGSVPLHNTSDAGVAELLIAGGANVNATDSLRRTPLHKAAHWPERAAVLALLLKKGANVEAQDERQQTPLHVAAHYNPEAVGPLLEKNASVAARDRDGQTPLHLAAWAGFKGAVHLLLAHHADSHTRDGAGFCANAMAEVRGHTALASQLPCTRQGLDWWRHTSKAPNGWKALALATALLLGSRWLALRRSANPKYEPNAPVGASLVAGWAVYPLWAMLAAQLYRAVEVFSNTALPMFLMLRLSPFLCVLLLGLLYALPAVFFTADGGAGLVHKPLLTLSASRHSLLRLGHWDRDLLGLLWAPARLGILFAIRSALTQEGSAQLREGFRHCVYCNPHGEEALTLTAVNDQAALCLPLPEFLSEPLQTLLWHHHEPWEVLEGSCRRDEAFCLESPALDSQSQSYSCRIHVPWPATFLLETVDWYNSSGAAGAEGGRAGPAGEDLLFIDTARGRRSFSHHHPPPSDRLVPTGELFWEPSPTWHPTNAWRLCPSKKQICFPFFSVGDLWQQFYATVKYSSNIYAGVSVVLLGISWVMKRRLRKCDYDKVVSNVTAEILATIEENPAPMDASAKVIQIKGLGGRQVEATSVIQVVIFLLLDFLLDLNTVRLLLASDDYMFAAIIGSASVGSTLIELQHGGLSGVRSAINETMRTGVPTAAYMRIMGTEKGEAWISLMVTSYAIPFSVRTTFDLFTTSLSLLTSSIALSYYFLEELDVGTDAEVLETDSTTSDSGDDTTISCTSSTEA